MPYKPLTNMKKISPKAIKEGRYKCVVCGQNAVRFKLENPYCAEHWKEAEKKYQKKYQLKYYPENKEKLCKNARKWWRDNYVHHPHKNLTEEEKKQRKNKDCKEYYQKNKIPCKRKKVPELQIIRNAEMRIERKRANYFLNRKKKKGEKFK